MPNMSELMREYGAILDQERQLSDRKHRLRSAIMEEMKRTGIKYSNTGSGSAQLSYRFKLHPKAEQVLALLTSEDLYFFARFTPARVKEMLVPRYGRERLIPLFDYEKTESLTIKRPPGQFS